MVGFWQGLQQASRVLSAPDPNDERMHYPDYWKTPYHVTFSAESQWALPTAPMWNAQDRAVRPDHVRRQGTMIAGRSPQTWREC